MGNGMVHAVYPTVVLDDIIARTPDVLLTGEATLQMIDNCIPSIKEVDKILACDVPHILASIKLASFGNDTEVSFKCPKCDQLDMYSIDIQKLISTISAKKWFSPLEMDELTLLFHPPTYKQQSAIDVLKYRYDRQLFQISKTENPSDYVDLITSLIEKKSQLLLGAISDCIQKIIIHETDEIVDSRDFINEWFSQIDSTQQSFIVNYLEKAKSQSRMDKVSIQCYTCKHVSTVPLDLDISTRFRDGLIQMSEEEIMDTIQKMGNEVKNIKFEMLKATWFMRGGLSYNDAMYLTIEERKMISKIVEDNIELTQKIGMPVL